MPLSQREAVPYGLGYREYGRYDGNAADCVTAMWDLIIYATHRERKALLTDNSEHFACWVAIGVMQKHIELSIVRARSI